MAASSQTEYKLQVWDKTRRRYWTCWTGQDLQIAERIERKPYHRRDWQGKARILKVTVEVVKEVPARARRYR